MANAQETKAPSHHDQPILIEQKLTLGNLENISRFHNIHMSGQPDQATLLSLKDADFTMVINIRSPEEMSFDEKTLVENNGLAYHMIPLLKDGKIQDSAVNQILSAIKSANSGKILLHCSSGNRVAAWLGSHFYRDHKISLEKSVAYAKQAGITKKGAEALLRHFIGTLD